MMGIRPIGYYVHHHGEGHHKRARAIAGANKRIVLLGTGVGDEGVNLADDRPRSGMFDGIDEADCRPNALHYAPIDHDGVRARVATMARWIEAQQPALMVVDVSVEVAMLARLASVRVIYVRLNGDRRDDAHLDSFRGALRLLAPFPEALEPAGTPTWVREKTRYLPGITNFSPSRQTDVQNNVLVVIGRGGSGGDGDIWAEVARNNAQRRWRVIGPCTAPRDCPPNLQILGWVHDPETEIARAAVVVGACGDGLVMSILAADRPFICMPQHRPYDEQHATAERLGDLGAAVVVTEWPSPEKWSKLIEEALMLEPNARRSLHDPHGVRSAAEWINAMADEAGPRSDEAA